MMSASAQKFSFHGKTLSYDANRVEYNRLRYLFECFAKKQEEKLYSEYDAFGGLDTFYERYEKWMTPYFYACCDLAISELVKLKCYDEDRESYFNNVFDCSQIGEVLAPIDKFYEELAEKKGERSAAHSQRFHAGTHLRNNYIDGAEAGFSTSVNIIGGSAALGVNAIASGLNFIADSCNKSDLYDKSREPVVSAVLFCLRSAYYELIDYARKHCSGYGVKNISRADRDKASGIYKNLAAGKIPAKERIDCISEILLLNPYLDGVYHYTMLNYGDSESELQNLADFFHVAGLHDLQIRMLHDFYRTVDVSSEEKALAARELMKKKAAYLGMKSYSSFAPLERGIVDFDLQYRTVCGIVRDSRAEADAQRVLYDYYRTLDFESGRSAALASGEKLRKKAEELKLSAAWLEPYIEYSMKRIQQKAKAALETFYRSLVLDTEEKALAARKTIAEKAAELEIDGFKNYHPLEELVKRYDLHYRTVGGKTFKTRKEADKQKTLWSAYLAADYRQDERTAADLKNRLLSIAGENGIDGGWLVGRVDAALKHFDEKARTRFDYRYDTREEAARAVAEEAVFFKALWAGIAEFIRQNPFLLRWGMIPENKQSVISEALELTEKPFAYMHTTLLSSGKTGLAITPSGLVWNNGSALMLGIANNVVFKSIFKKKAQDMQEQNQILKYSATWKEFFESEVEFAPDEKNNITIVPGKVFEASHSKPKEFCELLKMIHSWKKELQFRFSGSPAAIPDEKFLHTAQEPSPMPEAEKAEDRPVTQEEGDFIPDKSSVVEPQEPFPDNSVLLKCAAKYRKPQAGLMIAPAVNRELYGNFLGELDEKLRKQAAKESPICQADHTMLFKNGKKGVLLTSDALYCHNGSEEWRVPLSDVIAVAGSGKSLLITCADAECYSAEGAGMQELTEILRSALLGDPEKWRGAKK